MYIIPDGYNHPYGTHQNRYENEVFEKRVGFEIKK